MSVFVDTSAFYAALDVEDDNHSVAQQIWQQLLQGHVLLHSTSYVVVETFALVQRRLGMAAVRVLQEDLMPFVVIHWVDQETHTAGVESLITVDRRSLSLVDCVSFVVMRQLGIRDAFAFDDHFTEQGFTLLT